MRRKGLLQAGGAGWGAWTAAVLLAGILIPGLGACAAPPEAPGAAWVDALGGGWSPVPYGSGGSVEVTPEGLTLGPGYPLSGVAFEAVPRVPYELVAVARRDQGDDFFAGLTFPVEGGHLTLVLGGWGGATCGLSCLDGLDAASNETTRHLWHPPGQWVELRLRVERDRLLIDLDGERAWDLALEGRACALRTEVLASAPFSWSTFATGATLGRLAWRPLDGRRTVRDLSVRVLAESYAADSGRAREATALLGTRPASRD
ncbi:MAG: hypothetical protein ISQ08_11975 [Planctomycetes bacterium]|nr:hypothetical protein [Planctomycetota bacterium]